MESLLQKIHHVKSNTFCTKIHGCLVQIIFLSWVMCRFPAVHLPGCSHKMFDWFEEFCSFLSLWLIQGSLSRTIAALFLCLGAETLCRCEAAIKLEAYARTCILLHICIKRIRNWTSSRAKITHTQVVSQYLIFCARSHPGNISESRSYWKF